MVYHSSYCQKKRLIVWKSPFWYLVFYCLFYDEKNCKVNGIVISLGNGAPWSQWWCTLFTEAIFHQSRVPVFYYPAEYTSKYKFSSWTAMLEINIGKQNDKGNNWCLSEKQKCAWFTLLVTVATLNTGNVQLKWDCSYSRTHTHAQKQMLLS